MKVHGFSTEQVGTGTTTCRQKGPDSAEPNVKNNLTVGGRYSRVEASLHYRANSQTVERLKVCLAVVK